MDMDQAREFVRGNHHGLLTTRTSDNGIQQSPVLVGVDDRGRFTVSSRETAYKTKNLRRDPWAFLCILPDSFFGDWITLTGNAEVLSLPDAMEPLVEYYRAVAGEHEDWDGYRESMRSEQRVLIRVNAISAGPDRAG